MLLAQRQHAAGAEWTSWCLHWMLIFDSCCTFLRKEHCRNYYQIFPHAFKHWPVQNTSFKAPSIIIISAQHLPPAFHLWVVQPNINIVAERRFFFLSTSTISTLLMRSKKGWAGNANCSRGLCIGQTETGTELSKSEELKLEELNLRVSV